MVLKYTNILKNLTYGIIDNNNKKIINFLPFICINNILSLDKYFVQFVDDLDSWWLKNVIDISTYRVNIY